MTITIEEISGKRYTVVWHKDECPTFTVYCNDGGQLFCHRDGTHIATALPALPRALDVGTERLSYLYWAHGIKVYGKHWDEFQGCHFIHPSYHVTVWGGYEYSHAEFNGERVEIAIEG